MDFHHVVFLHDGGDTLVEIWLQEDERVFRASTRYIDTIDLHPVKRFLEQFDIPCEVVDNS
jgi:hypothetical protein